ncbi:unnamed protein product [Fraxinus pennsylvanica]|uniref:Uncharacterized protein n=1 Tax=Fraxinus pennsylvanica TaxID=56036 RepID=A0AAD2DW63_9LAMI|nr:unnamed protein product [Fraxinus pennsylvanica]
MRGLDILRVSGAQKNSSSKSYEIDSDFLEFNKLVKTLLQEWDTSLEQRVLNLTFKLDPLCTSNLQDQIQEEKINQQEEDRMWLLIIWLNLQLMIGNCQAFFHIISLLSNILASPARRSRVKRGTKGERKCL